MIKILSFALILPLAVLAEEKVDENALFADSSSVVDSSKIVNTQSAKNAAEEKRGVGFSGNVYAYADPAIGRSWFDNPDLNTVKFDSRIVGNGFVDVRLIGGAKAFIDLQGSYVPNPSFATIDLGNLAPSDSGILGKPDSGMVFDVPEIFVDANIKKIVYLRAGKQVLQWGPCTFWNPTDLVNIENKTFLQKEGQREGTYGLKIHIPYKTLFNFYSFIDANHAPTADSLAVALKAEVLIGRTEMALSTWGKEGKKPVAGFDLTSQLFNVQIAAEASLRNGIDILTLDSTFTNVTNLGDKWYPRVSVNLTRTFPLGGVADRLTISTEGYWNYAGYNHNIFGDSALLARIATSQLGGQNGNSLSDLYQPSNYSKYYAAVFFSIGQFILDDMTFTCNAIGNLQQKSYVVTTGVNYQSLNDFVFGVSLNAYLGPKNTEYTFSGNALSMQVRTGMIF